MIAVLYYIIHSGNAFKDFVVKEGEIDLKTVLFLTHYITAAKGQGNNVAAAPCNLTVILYE